ncbi:hypothetical protein MUK42_30840 [Musa troglodytarum]|uniref:Uncharacterized protein n=1 Tax=Musa troglodytarum TaxID=320322 RepID=A0A9E7FKK1_9LILI|nr:hypothetical protein MUK42_30840 [Musa troglodytarum]
MAGDDPTFPAANAAEENDLGKPNEFPVDPISSDLATSKEPNKEEEAKARAGKCDLGSTLTSVLMISGAVIAAVGVAFFVTKKLKET